MQKPAPWHVHASAQALAEAVAAEVVAAVADTVDRRGMALLALPGGQTPRATFGLLRQTLLPWGAVTLLPTDERLVPTGDALRNDALLEAAFGDSGAKILSLVEGQEANSSAEQADARLRCLPWAPDLVWLGMGGDGHTASLFVGPDLERALDRAAPALAAAVRPRPLPPEAPVDRVSLTSAAILQARRVLVTITGEAKRALLEQALRDGAASTLPIGRLLAGAPTPVAIHWAP
jgi:6-phosphogluconolactonase